MIFYLEYNIKNFPTDNSSVCEMEFYLLEDLDFHLVIFHPYRALMQLCGKGLDYSKTVAKDIASPAAESGSSFQVTDAQFHTAWYGFEGSFFKFETFL